MDRGKKSGARPEYPTPSIGDRFGELTVTGYELGVRGGISYLIVQCSCGAAEHRVATYNIYNGKSTRCNACAKKQSNYYHKNYWGYAAIVPDGGHRTRLLNRISAIINRCRNSNDGGYANYGGRGITVYDEWVSDRKRFLAHLITLDGWDRPELELDREDNNLGYVPGNLRFVTKKANSQNKRTIKQLEAEIADLRYRLSRYEK